MSDQERYQKEMTRIKSLIDQQIIDKELYLNNQNVQNEIVEYLCSRRTEQLKMILIGWNGITSAGIAHFQRAKWTNLRNLSLWSNHLGSKGCKLLARAKFQQLQFLNLNKNLIENPGIHHLSKAKFSNLTKIQLQQNRLKSQSVEYLIRTNWKQFKKLQLYFNSIGVDGVKYLVMTPNNLELIRLTIRERFETPDNALKAILKSKFREIQIQL